MYYLVLVRGLPGSGKSTMASSMYGFTHFEADMFFYEEGEYRFDPTRLKEAHAWCQNCTRTALQTERNVVVSNTFTTVAEMEPYFAMAQELGIPCGVFECVGEYGSIHGVPEHTIQRMKDRWEKIIPGTNVPREVILLTKENRNGL